MFRLNLATNAPETKADNNLTQEDLDSQKRFQQAQAAFIKEAMTPEKLVETMTLLKTPHQTPPQPKTKIEELMGKVMEMPHKVDVAKIPRVKTYSSVPKTNTDVAPAWMTGLSTGLIGSAVCLPFDIRKLQKQIGKGKMTFTNAYTTILKPVTACYPAAALTKVMRYGGVYWITPHILSTLEAHTTWEHKRPVAHMIAGFLDGVTSAGLKVVNQKKQTNPNESLHWNQFNNKRFFQSWKIAAAAYGPSYALYWPIFQGISDSINKVIGADPAKNDACKKQKQFISGAIAGIAAGGIVYPLESISAKVIDSQLNQVGNASKQSLIKETLNVLAEAKKTHGIIGMIPRRLYAGFGTGVALKQFFSGGANKVAVGLANNLHHKLERKQQILDAQQKSHQATAPTNAPTISTNPHSFAFTSGMGLLAAVQADAETPEANKHSRR